ncbi:MAG: sigma-70 family RNA polymerase sigma factor, partial [Planctomycetota bacterium]
MESTSQQLQQEQLLAQMGWIRGLAKGLVADPSLADDIAQEAWLAAQTAPPTRLEGEGSLRAWLTTVVRNLARKAGRSSARRSGREAQSARPEATESTVDVVVRGAMHRDLTNRVMNLAEPNRSAILLRYLEDLPTAEVARRQGITPAAARKRISRGMEDLRESLDAAHDGDRQAWSMVLVSLSKLGVTPPVATTAWTSSGALAMTLKISASLAAVLIALFAYFGGASSADSDSPDNTRGEALPLSFTATSAADSGETATESGTRVPVAAPAPGISILDAEGVPLVDALVLLLRGGQLLDSVHTNAAGRVELDATEETVDVLVASRGHALTRFDEISIVEHQELRLTAASSLTGVVTGLSSPEDLELVLSSDKPSVACEGLGVEARDLLAAQGFTDNEVPTQPDSSGAFRFAGLPAHWSGALLAPEGTRFAESPSRGAVLDPRTLLFMDPVRDLRLPLEHLASLRGRVVDVDSGAPIAKLALLARFALDEHRSGPLLRASTDEEGVFRIAVPMQRESKKPWALDVQALDMNLSEAEWSFRSEDLGGSTDLGVLEVSLGAEVRFLAQGEDGVPIAGAVGFMPETLVHSPPTDAGGRASMFGLRGERASLTVTAPGYAVTETFVESAKEEIVTMRAARSLRIHVRRPNSEDVSDLHVRILGEDSVWQGNGPLGWLDLEIPTEDGELSRGVLEGFRPLEQDGTLEVGPLRP